MQYCRSNSSAPYHDISTVATDSHGSPSNNARAESIIWSATIRPSKLHQSLNFLLSFAAILSIAVTPLPLYAKTVMLLSLVLLAVFRVTVIAEPRQLLQINSPNDKPSESINTGSESSRWQLRRGNSEAITGTLITAGYRSAGLVVMVIQSADCRWHRIPVWVDSVESEQFSYLHFQIAFNSQSPDTRTLKALLQNLT